MLKNLRTCESFFRFEFRTLSYEVLQLGMKWFPISRIKRNWPVFVLIMSNAGWKISDSELIENNSKSPDINSSCHYYICALYLWSHIVESALYLRKYCFSFSITELGKSEITKLYNFTSVFIFMSQVILNLHISMDNILRMHIV